MSDLKTTTEPEARAREDRPPAEIPNPVQLFLPAVCGCDGKTCPWHGECEGDLRHGSHGGWGSSWVEMARLSHCDLRYLCDVCFVGEVGDMLYDSEWDAIAARRGEDWTQVMFERCGPGSWTQFRNGSVEWPLDNKPTSPHAP